MTYRGIDRFIGHVGSARNEAVADRVNRRPCPSQQSARVTTGAINECTRAHANSNKDQKRHDREFPTESGRFAIVWSACKLDGVGFVQSCTRSKSRLEGLRIAAE